VSVVGCDIVEVGWTIDHRTRNVKNCGSGEKKRSLEMRKYNYFIPTAYYATERLVVNLQFSYPNEVKLEVSSLS
jgi:hypothetical protein